MMNSTKKVRVIVYWITCGICMTLARPDERRWNWMTQIATFLEPVSTLVNTECKNDTLEYLKASENISNLWAISMIDANGKFPSGILSGNIRSMGNFDQCLRIKHPKNKYSGKYCLTKLKYSTYGPNKVILQNYIDFVMAGRRLLELGDDWANEPCSHRLAPPTNVAETCCSFTAHYLLQASQIRTILYIGYTKCSAGILDIEDLYFGTLILPTYSSSELAVCLPSTCSANDVAILTRDAIRRATIDIGLKVAVYLEDDLCYTESQSSPFNNVDYFVTFIIMTLVILTIIGSASSQIDSVKKRNGVFPKILRAFSIIDNWKQLTNLNSPSNDVISCLEGIRTLSTIWVVMTHQTMLISQVAYINKLETMQTHNDYGYYAMWNSYFNVDTFLLVSGLLRAYNFTKELAQNRVNLFKSGLQRYLRLTPAYLFVILFYISYFDRIDYGPAWNLYVGRNGEACRKYWWQNLLYINNYIPHNEKCLLQSWYLSADMQLFLIAPLLVYPLWKWKLIGKLLITLAIIISVVIPFVTTWINEFPGTYMFTASNSVLNSYAHHLYMATHDRMSPYFVGLVLGYIFHLKKPVALAKWQVAAGWIASLGVMYACVYGARNMTSFQHVYNIWESALYGGLHRFAWSVAVAWVVYACHAGYGGPVNTFLSCSTFRFLGRLSYSVFLTHLAVLLYNAAVVQVPRQLHTYISIRDFMGDFVFIFAVSLPLYIFVELPFYGVTKEIFKKKII